jgi:RimJ/RimL family protein N-acetyltransferase
MPQPDFQPTLVGPTVIVRPVTPADWTELFAAASDPDIWKVHPAPDRYTEPVFRKFFDDAIACGKAFVFVDRAANRLIGASRYHDHKPDESEIEIGWTFLARSHWGGATNREVKRLMLDHAFGFVDTVVFWVGEKNFRSQGAMKKIGGVLRPGIFERPVSDGTPYVIFEITRERYQNGGRALVA